MTTFWVETGYSCFLGTYILLSDARKGTLTLTLCVFDAAECMNIAVSLQVQQMRRVQLCCRSIYGATFRFHVDATSTRGIHSTSL